MSKLRGILVLATAAVLGTGCARYSQGSAAGTVIDPVDAAKTVVLHVDNQNMSAMELRAVVNGRSQFIGSVGGNDSTSILLDPTWFPSGTFYVTGIAADGQGRAVGGPIAAGRGDRIIFSIQPALDMSRAVVRR
jgi:hypothetical protein